MSRNLRTHITSLFYSATLRALTNQRWACEFFFARRVAEFWEFLLLAKQESTWSRPSYGLGVNGGCARLLQPYLPVPGTKIKTLKVSLRSTTAPATPAPWGGLGRGLPSRQPLPPHGGGPGRGFPVFFKHGRHGINGISIRHISMKRMPRRGNRFHGTCAPTSLVS